MLSRYIPKDVENMLPVKSFSPEETVNPSEREAIIRMIYQLRQEVDYLKEVVLGGLPLADSFPVAENGHPCGRKGSLLTFRRRRTHPEYEVFVKESPLSRRCLTPSKVSILFTEKCGPTSLRTSI